MSDDQGDGKPPATGGHENARDGADVGMRVPDNWAKEPAEARASSFVALLTEELPPGDHVHKLGDGWGGRRTWVPISSVTVEAATEELRGILVQWDAGWHPPMGQPSSFTALRACLVETSGSLEVPVKEWYREARDLVERKKAADQASKKRRIEKARAIYERLMASIEAEHPDHPVDIAQEVTKFSHELLEEDRVRRLGENRAREWMAENQQWSDPCNPSRWVGEPGQDGVQIFK